MPGQHLKEMERGREEERSEMGGWALRGRFLPTCPVPWHLPAAQALVVWLL